MKKITATLVILLLVGLTSKAQVQLPPTLVSPQNGATNVSLTPTFQWNFIIIIGLLSGYRLQIATDNTFTNIIHDKPGLTTQSYILPQGILQPGTSYHWRVNATLILGIGVITTSWSTPFSFTTENVTGITQISSGVPAEYKLHSNFPNPFNPSTKIRFDLKSAGDAELIIFNVLGERVAEEQFGKLSAGYYQYEWNAADMPSGVYFYRLESGSFTDTRKMILVK
ncbi:MAG: T9SS type A sorting domain-containing protein [Chlorobi bacterium]|nr:T9SS type A sorting domain-containing protein [Chlorobiota bacterium]MCI0717256.1 T9SS type A sorting domain-containing protein [Chlorobiota bacterium]